MLKTNVVKSSQWTFKVYQENITFDEMVNHLKLVGYPASISPLHDLDLLSDSVTDYVKPHWHILVKLPNTTTKNHIITTYCEPLKTNLYAEAVFSLESIYKYHTHEDFKDKAQYNKDDITNLNGFNIANFRNESLQDIDSYIFQIMDLIEAQNISDYFELMNYLRFFDDDGILFHVASTRTIFFNAYLRNKKYKLTVKVNT